MKTRYTILSVIVSTLCYAQHNHQGDGSLKKWDVKPIFNLALTDSSFVGKEMRLALFTVPAGGVDTVTHVHDCHLVGYVLEGELITKLKDKEPQHLRQGDIFYEFPNEVHQSLQNVSRKREAKILLYYLFNNGATLYKKLFQHE